MGFGQNPFIGKAEAAEEKALAATNVASEMRLYLEAAHLWERAAAKEKPGKRRTEFEAKAEAIREKATAAEAKPSPSLSSVAARFKLVAGNPAKGEPPKG